MTLNKPFPYNSSSKTHIIIGIILGLLLGFILIIVEPFNLNNFNHKYGDIVLMGFGFIKFSNYIIAHLLENFYYKKFKKWSLWNELVFLVLSSLSGGVLGYIYLDIFIENQPLSFLRLILFFYYIVLPLLPLIIFPKSVLRYILTKKTTSESKVNNTLIEDIPLEKITLKGQNLKDELSFIKKELIYVKSIDNYIQVYYMDEQLKSKVLRAKLSEILVQAPFLVKSHRSYLINPQHSFKVKGNSQKAVLTLKALEEDIPVSRMTYKTIKALFN